MRRRLVLATMGVLVPVVLAGCGLSGTLEGSPSADLSSAPAAQPAPAVGHCYLTVVTVSYPAANPPVDCAKTHRAETVSVGVFTDTYAGMPSLPAAGSDALRSAFDACDIESQRFVGGDWRGGRLSIQVVVPSPTGWAAGSRWYRCDIFELVALDGGTARSHPDDHPLERTGSLRDALTRKLPLVYTCFEEDQWEYLIPVACTEPHGFEFVGIWTAPDLAYDKVQQGTKRAWRECYTAIAKYTGMPRTKVEYEMGVTYRMPSPEAWERGDRGVKCFLWLESRKVTKSLRSNDLPVRHA